MKTLDKIKDKSFPLKWANLDLYTDSNGHKIEIYLIKDDNLTEGLILMFYALFRTVKNNIQVYNPYWWDYCLDTWVTKEDRYDYEIEGKSVQTMNYLLMLKESSIELGYSGICRCNDWDKFLSITLTCIVTHIAPFSPVFYDEGNDFFFYFHHSGSIGFYYKERNEVVDEILSIAKDEYDAR